jgi:hypothetical protein
MQRGGDLRVRASVGEVLQHVELARCEVQPLRRAVGEAFERRAAGVHEQRLAARREADELGDAVRVELALHRVRRRRRERGRDSRTALADRDARHVTDPQRRELRTAVGVVQVDDGNIGELRLVDRVQAALLERPQDRLAPPPATRRDEHLQLMRLPHLLVDSRRRSRLSATVAGGLRTAPNEPCCGPERHPLWFVCRRVQALQPR